MTDPFALFDEWYAQARETELNDSNAMALATADAQGRPSVRMVLLKGHGPDGFIFYTNFEGRKAGDLLANPDQAYRCPRHRRQGQNDPAQQLAPAEAPLPTHDRPGILTLITHPHPPGRSPPD